MVHPASVSQHNQRTTNAPKIERKLPPVIAVIGTVPYFAIAQPRVDVAWRVRISQQGIGHIVQRLWKSTVQLLPGCASCGPKDIGVRFAINMRRWWTGPGIYEHRGRRDVPHVGASGIGRAGPAISTIQPCSGLCPGLAAIAAEGDTSSSTFIDPIAVGSVKGQRMAIPYRTRPMAGPGLSAISTAHNRAGFDADDNHIRIARREGDLSRGVQTEKG